MTEEKVNLMHYLYMKTDDMNDAKNVEKLFCLALLQEGPELTQKVLKRVIDYRNTLLDKED